MNGPLCSATAVKSKVKILQTFVAFLEYMNFKEILPGKMIEHECTTQYNLLFAFIQSECIWSSTFVKSIDSRKNIHVLILNMYHISYVRLFNKRSMMRT